MKYAPAEGHKKRYLLKIRIGPGLAGGSTEGKLDCLWYASAEDAVCYVLAPKTCTAVGGRVPAGRGERLDGAGEFCG